MKKTTILLVNKINIDTKSILFYTTVFLMLLVGVSSHAQGPYQYYNGANASQMGADGWQQSGGNWSFPSSPVGARSGTQYILQTSSNSPAYFRTPKINTPQTFSFWVKATSPAVTCAVSFSDDNGATYNVIPNGATTASSLTHPTPFAVSSAVVPILTTAWQQITVTAAFPANALGYYFKIADTRVLGTAGSIYFDDFSWTSSVATDNNIIVPTLNSTTLVTVPVANGMVYHFYDVGGLYEEYSKGQNNNVVFTPVSPADKIKVTFVSGNFATADASNKINVYDNTTTVGGVNPIYGSPFWGGTPLATPYVSSLSTNGSLAIQFVSSGTYSSGGTASLADGFDLKIECSPPVCQLPTTTPTISNIGSTTATIKWTGISPGYEYAATLTNTPPGAAGTYTTGVMGSLTGLAPNTFYYGWVRAKCSGTFFSNWVMSAGFTTLCAASNLPYLEDFTGWSYILPDCTSTTGGDWQTNLPTGNLLATTSGNFFFTKPLALSAATIYTLSYNYAALFGTANFDVYIGTANDATMLTPVNKLVSHTGVSTAAANAIQFTKATAGTYYIGFYLTSTSNPGTTQLNLDNISVDCTTPIIAPSTTSICTPNTIVTLIGSGVSGYKWAASAGTLYSDAAATIPYVANTNATTVYFKTTTNATITVTSINGACSKTATVNIVFKSTTWDGTIWSNGVPDSTTQAVFNGNYTSVSDLNACSVVVTSGDVLIKAGNSLIVQNAVNVVGGTLTFENNASLVQVNNVVNTAGSYNGGNVGTITYQRDTNPMKMYDFTYWSAPVYPQTLVGLSPLTMADKYLSFTAATSSWTSVNSNSLMNPGQGYIIRSPQNFDSSVAQVYHASFVGTPNNGTITTPIVGPGNLNLIGNPYPSALNIDLFMASPLNSAIVDKTIYLWTHNTAITNNNYSNNDYAAYNYLGGTGTSAAPSGTTGGLNNNVPTGKIASGQSFFIKGLGSGTATFQNSMRVVGNNSQFFKNANQNQSQPVAMNRIWLDISNNQGGYKQTLVGYTEKATLGLDKGYDGDYFSFGSPISLYSLVETNQLAIQGRPMPFDTSDEVPLGFNTTTTGTITINLYDFDGLFTNQEIYLKDKQLNTVVNLKQGAYSFAANAGTYNDRFVLVYKNSTVATNNSSFNENAIVLFKPNQDLFIDAGTTTMNKVRVYDVRGSLLVEKQAINDTKTSLNIGTTNQVLLIEITSADGEIVTKKYIN